MDDRTALTAATIVERRADIAFERIDDDLLAVDAYAGICYSLNLSAGRVWELMATPVAVGHICAELCREYRVDEATCLHEVAAVLDGLRKAGLVRVVGTTKR